MEMTTSRPYLIRAIYEWIVDNKFTPYLLVDVTKPDVQVPARFATNGRIILNVGPLAAKHLALGNEDITFLARFSGQPMEILIPCEAVIAIYAKENGRGMVFQEDNISTAEPAEFTRNGILSNEQDELTPPPPPPGDGKNKPHLRIVK